MLTIQILLETIKQYEDLDESHFQSKLIALPLKDKGPLNFSSVTDTDIRKEMYIGFGKGYSKFKDGKIQTVYCILPREFVRPEYEPYRDARDMSMYKYWLPENEFNILLARHTVSSRELIKMFNKEEDKMGNTASIYPAHGKVHYEVRICSCGTIHFIPDNKITKALENDKDLLWICGSCGQGTRIGADREPNIYDDSPDAPDEIFNMYSFDFNPNHVSDTISLTAKDFVNTRKHKGIEEIFYSQGVKVPMMSGYNAKMYNSAGRYFLDIWWPDWYKIEGPDKSREDILKFIENYKQEVKTINMHAFVRQTKAEYLEVLANRWMDEFDWTGTPYEEMHKEYMKKFEVK